MGAEIENQRIISNDIADSKNQQISRLSDLESSMELVVAALRTLAPAAFDQGLEI